MLRSIFKRPKLPLKPGLLGGIVLSLMVGLMCHYIAGRVIESDNEVRFRNMATVSQYAINARIKAYTDLLRSAASVFQMNNNLTRAEFRRFVDGLDVEKHFPALESVNYLQWLSDAERDGFEAKVRREDRQANDGRPLFQIRPAGRRPYYLVVRYVEPDLAFRATVGIDLNADPMRARVAAESRDTGALATSGAPIDAMKARKLTGLGMRLPLYRAGAPLRTVEERRAAFLGSVGIAFNVQRMVEGVLDEVPAPGMRMRLFNKVSSANPAVPPKTQLLYDSSATAGNPAPAPLANDPDNFTVVLPIDFNGRVWTAHFSVAQSALARSPDQPFHWMALLAGFASTMLLYSLYYTLTSSRKRAVALARGMVRELRRSHESLRRLSAHAENIKENERRRIAREIHDDLGQNLLALRIDAQLLFTRTRCTHHRLHSRAESTLAQIDATIKSVRQIINDLRPNVLDLGLNAAVSWQIAEFRRRTGIDCELIEHNVEIVANDQCATALFRILQESLSNVARHAEATRVRVDLSLERGRVSMTVHDNGIGLLPGSGNNPGFGLIGIRERVNILGGTCSIAGTPGRGTTITVTLPSHPPEPDAAGTPASPPAHDEAAPAAT